VTVTNRFFTAENYAVLYSGGFEEELSLFDIAIVEPSARDRTSLQIIRKNGTVVLAYVSAMEVHQWSDEFKFLKSSDYLKSGGQPMINHNYGTYIADLRSKTWKNLLYHKIGRLLLSSGYDGIFVDTIGDIESPQINEGLKDELAITAAEFFSQIKEISKDSIIVQNNGLEKLCLYTSGIIDGICWENPPFAIKDSRLWVRQVLERIERVRAESRLKIMLLLEEFEDSKSSGKGQFEDSLKIALDEASRRDFLFYRAPLMYIEKVNPRV
jgi:hypothetical protein